MSQPELPVTPPPPSFATGGPTAPPFDAHPATFPAPVAAEPVAADFKPTTIKAPRKVLFNLDELENDRSSEPFVFTYQGKEFELLDPKDCDWQDLLVVQEDPRLTLHVLMKEEDRKDFLELKLPMRKFEALLKRWQEHFNQPTPGEGNGSALS
jgi:hypothetical protein